MTVAAYHDTMAGKSLTAVAPAKINLNLRVLRRRSDGFHELRSVVMGVDLCDHVVCRPTDGEAPQIRCGVPALENQENSAAKAATALANTVGRKPSVHFDIRKSIPLGGGMGGGSSNAAAALRLCNQLWAAGLDRSELASIASILGSDVPLFFWLPAALISGRGERVEPISLRWKGWILLVSVGVPVSTKDVYAGWTSSNGPTVDSTPVDALQRASTAEELSAFLSNDLEPAVFRVSPAVARAYERLHSCGFGPFHVTGAGSTLFRLFDDQEAACRVARAIDDRHFSVTTSVNAAPFAAGPIVSKDN